MAFFIFNNSRKLLSKSLVPILLFSGSVHPLPLFGASKDGGLPGSFLRFGAGSRALGMGGAFGGIADDATALYWNPAGLSLLVKPELNATRIALFEDTFHDFIAFAMPPRRYGAFGLGYLSQSSGGFEKRTNPFDAPTSFSIVKSAVQGGWGLGLPKLPYLPGQFRVGASVKQVSETIDASRATGIGADLGLLYHLNGRFSLGILYQNVLAPEIRFGRPVTFARSFEVSPAYRQMLPGNLSTRLGARVSFYGGAVHPSGGLELWYGGLLALRAGYQSRGLSTGLGIQIFNYSLSYAVLLHEISPSHMISLGIRFGKTKEEIEADLQKGIQKFSQEEAKKLARTYFQQALNFEREGNFIQAMSYLDSASLLDPANAEIQKKLEELSAKKEEIGKKADEMVNRRLVEKLAALALEPYQNGEYALSQGYFRTVLEIDPGHDEAKRYLQEIEKKLSEAERLQARAPVGASRSKAQQLAAEAFGLIREGRVREAREQAQRALRLYPGEGMAQKILATATVLLKRGRDEKFSEGLRLVEGREFVRAARIFQEILKENPQDREAQKRLEECKAALQAARMTPEATAEVERLYYKAVDHYLKGQYAEAQKALGRVFEIDPLNEGALKLKAKLEAALGAAGGQK